MNKRVIDWSAVIQCHTIKVDNCIFVIMYSVFYYVVFFTAWNAVNCEVRIDQRIEIIHGIVFIYIFVALTASKILQSMSGK